MKSQISQNYCNTVINCNMSEIIRERLQEFDIFIEG